MRLFHLADLHFGKSVHSVSMIEDQRFWIHQFLEIVDQHHPQVVLISGDVYDKKSPSKEAIQLLDYLLTELSLREIYVLIIAGNHDSWYRLSFAKDILCNQKVYIAGEVQKELPCIDLEDEYGPIHFWMMPYLIPGVVSDKKVLGDPAITTYDQAVRALLDAQNIEKRERNVILIHQNVLAHGQKPDHSQSETIVGGLGEVDFSNFDHFEYVAMGHIHNAQKMGREEVRYAGCPLYYDFSECNRDKSLTMVDIHGKEEGVEIHKVSIPLLHKMKEMIGMLEDVLKEGEALKDKKDYYIQVILEDAHLPAYTMDRLRAVFGDQLIHVERRRRRMADEKEIDRAYYSEKSKEVPIQELFANYYLEQNEQVLDQDGEEILLKILEQQEESGINYVNHSDKVRIEDTEALLTYLMASEEDEA